MKRSFIMKTMNRFTKWKLKMIYMYPLYLRIFLLCSILYFGVYKFMPPVQKMILVISFTACGIFSFIFLVCRAKRFKTYSLYPDVFGEKCFYLGQKVSKALKKDPAACPYECFKQDLNEWVAAIPETAIYSLVTHERIIELIMETPEYKDGRIILTKTQSLYESDLKKLERKLVSEACGLCDLKRHPKCPVYWSQYGKHPRKTRDFYGVTVRKLKRPLESGVSAIDDVQFSHMLELSGSEKSFYKQLFKYGGTVFYKDSRETIGSEECAKKAKRDEKLRESIRERIPFFLCLTVLLLILLSSLAIAVKSIINATIGLESADFVYSKQEDIESVHEITETLAKITICDTYTKNNVLYYEFTTTATGSEVFTFSEDEYDALIGLNNDAIDCTTYTLTLSSPIIIYEQLSFFEENLLSMLKIDDIISYQPERFSFEKEYVYRINGPLNPRYYNWELECLSFDKDRQYASVTLNTASISTDFLTSDFKVTRYSFLGEQDFTEDDVLFYKEQLHDMNLFIIEAVTASGQ